MKYNKNKVSAQPTVPTYQGGDGYQLKPELELMALLSNGATDTYYKSESEQTKRLADLVVAVGTTDLDLAIKMLVYTRSVIGQRSVTHRAAVALLPLLAGNENGKYVFSKRDRKVNAGGLVYRLDDALEIAACYMQLNPGKRLPNSVTNGFKLALEAADEYELAKYQGQGKAVSLVDLVNLVHPKPRKQMAKVFKQLMAGELKQFDTVEDRNTKAGQDVAAAVKTGELTAEEGAGALQVAKADTFNELIDDGKLGYLALLRNLRNLVKAGAELAPAIKQLTDVAAVRKSLVFPHQIDLALETLMLEGSVPQHMIVALNQAYELAIPNLSELGASGSTAVVYDSSSSMTTKVRLSERSASAASAFDKACLIAATLAKGLGADVFTFSNDCKQVRYNPNDSVNTLKQHFVANGYGGGTSFSSIFNTLSKRYDRIFIVSDEQGQDQVHSTLNMYKNKFGVQPYIYCVNLCGYGTTMFKPGSKVFQVFGYSAELYNVIKRFEVDLNALLNEVRKINYLPIVTGKLVRSDEPRATKKKVGSKRSRVVKD